MSWLLRAHVIQHENRDYIALPTFFLHLKRPTPACSASAAWPNQKPRAGNRPTRAKSTISFRASASQPLDHHVYIQISSVKCQQPGPEKRTKLKRFGWWVPCSSRSSGQEGATRRIAICGGTALCFGLPRLFRNSSAAQAY